MRITYFMEIVCGNLASLMFFVVNDQLSLLTIPPECRICRFCTVKAAYSVTMNIFRKKKFLFKSFAKVE